MVFKGYRDVGEIIIELWDTLVKQKDMVIQSCLILGFEGYR